MNNLLPKEISELIFDRLDIDTLGKCHIAKTDVKRDVITDYKELKHLNYLERLRVYNKHSDHRRYVKNLTLLSKDDVLNKCDEYRHKFDGPNPAQEYIDAIHTYYLQKNRMRKLPGVDINYGYISEFLIPNFDQLQEPYSKDFENKVGYFVHNFFEGRPLDHQIKIITTFIIRMLSDKVLLNYKILLFFFTNHVMCIDIIIGTRDYPNINWKELWSQLRFWFKDRLNITDAQLETIKTSKNQNVHLAFIEVFPEVNL